MEKGEHTLDQKSYELLQTSIVQGADGLGHYLKKILNKPILLVAGNGREFYPERIPVAESIRKILCHMPSFQLKCGQESSHFSQERNGRNGSRLEY